MNISRMGLIQGFPNKITTVGILLTKTSSQHTYRLLGWEY